MSSNFLEEYRQISFQESVKVLADRLGIAVSIDVPRQVQRQNSPNQAFYDLHEDALKFYHAVLMTTKIGEAARAYLYERGMTDELLKTFKLAYPLTNQIISTSQFQKNMTKRC